MLLCSYSYFHPFGIATRPPIDCLRFRFRPDSTLRTTNSPPSHVRPNNGILKDSAIGIPDDTESKPASLLNPNFNIITMSRRDSQEPVGLLTPEESKQSFDVESDAGRAEQPKDQNLDHEYSISSTTKYTWLGTYFFFSLSLTIYNKLVLGMVSSISLCPVNILSRNAALEQSWRGKGLV